MASALRKAVNVMTELLTADHLKDPPAPAPKELRHSTN